MRKQMKIAAVISAAALLALGASITSFAAQRGTWRFEDGEWYCYDRNGDVYENTFCLSNGKEFYVGDSGQMVTSSWVEDDGDYYFVNSSGEKVINDWRLTTPYDDDSEDEQWFYFQASGKRAENKKLLIKGKTYFFNSDGEMMTGWVQASGDGWDEGSTDDVRNTDTYYCDETGARLERAWIKTYAPSVEEDDADTDDEAYYYLRSNGKVATRKQTNISGQTYFFNDEGRMLTGWVSQTQTDSNAYEQVWEDDEDTDGLYDTTLATLAANGADVYFCGDEDDGHMKKDKWLKVYNNLEYGQDDDDNSTYWFYIEKNGKIYIPSAADASAVRKDLDDGEAETFDEIFGNNNYDIDGNDLQITLKKINSRTYAFNANGQMVNDLIYILDSKSADLKNGMMYYFGTTDDGARKDGSVTMSDDSGENYRFYFATENNTSQHYYNAAGVNGARSGRLYQNGMLVTAKDYRYELKTVEIDGTSYQFIVNGSGSIQTSRKAYEEDSDTLIDASNATFRRATTDRGATYGSVEGAISYIN